MMVLALHRYEWLTLKSSISSPSPVTKIPEVIGPAIQRSTFLLPSIGTAMTQRRHYKWVDSYETEIGLQPVIDDKEGSATVAEAMFKFGARFGQESMKASASECSDGVAMARQERKKPSSVK
jgi:hypothetical protein